MRNQSGLVEPLVTRPERSEATTTLHGACRTLRRMSPERVRTIQVSLQVADLPVPRGSAEAFAQRIAMEYGVVARACAGETYLTVYLSRDTAPPPLTANHTRHEVKKWVSYFFSWLSR